VDEMDSLDWLNDSGGVSVSFALRVAVMVLFLLEAEVELEAEEVAVRRWGRRSKRGGGGSQERLFCW